jgi:mono/diheme cytochrome c family protein/cytochrome c553
MRTSFCSACSAAVLLAAGVLFLSGSFAREDTKAGEIDPKSRIDFARDVRPVFQARCISCHGPEKQKGELRLDRKAAALKGGDSGLVILPGKSADSPLLNRVASGDPKDRMPPRDERLTPEQIQVLRAWIDQGAAWPEDPATVAHKSHWAFKPVVRPEVPKTGVDGARNAIDHFIAARLARDGLAPTPEADRVTLIRRLKLDLLGLPPTPEEVEGFVQDGSPDAYDMLVDRYLASPHFGERWARHWLDVVRFAESTGFETNVARPNAWPYRDYVIRAFNEDRPYDQFIRDQLAGDAGSEGAATGFLVAGAYDQVKGDPLLNAQQRADELHDMISTTSSTFLGLTVGCARCHDHKFDPVSQLDYYRMKALLAGVQHGERSVQLTARAGERRDKDFADVNRELASIEARLAQREPRTGPGGLLLMKTETPGVRQLLPRLGVENYQEGGGRGQRDDLGDARRLPNMGKGYSTWCQVAGRDLFAWEPRVNGRFRIWLSWGSKQNVHAGDVRYILETGKKQVEIACVDQRTFADGTNPNPGQGVWSEFFDAGVRELTPESRILLRGGESNGVVTADLLLLEPAAADEKGKSAAAIPRLRPPVNPRRNSERFAPVEARFVRMTILETTGNSEPCIDELEVFSAGERPRNVALTSNGARAAASSTLPGYEIHKLEHINDGRYGNNWSWISNERGRGWVQLEFPEVVRIDHIVWGRNRGDGYTDRLATKYRLEVAVKPGEFTTIASSDDRLPLGSRVQLPALPAGLSADERAALQTLAERQRVLEARLRSLTTPAMIYAGQFTNPEPTHRLHRGEVAQKRELVAPGAPAEFGAPLVLPMSAPEQQRRLALAGWIADPKNPLTARVMVNRLWKYHFGTGIAATPSDFGLNGGRPSHPELLDYLADEFVAKGWRMKEIHRLIVLSRTYRQASTANPKGLKTDAGSRLLWRYPPRRLEAESLRDSILFVSGKLDLTMGGPGFDLFEPNTNYVKLYTPKKVFGPAEWRRMIYQSKPRMRLDDVFGAFDCPDAGQTTPARTTSTTPLQVLNLLNSPFMQQQAGEFALRLRKDAGDDQGAQVRRGYWLAYQRTPDAEEIAEGVKLVQQHGLKAFCLGLFNTSEFMYVY